VGRRGRRQRPPGAPSSDYTDTDGNVLTLRGSLSPASRANYARTLAGAGTGAGAAQSRDDAAQRALELLFELLAVRWVIAGAPIERQRELVGRLRMATSDERTAVRRALREHCTEHFPDVDAP